MTRQIRMLGVIEEWGVYCGAVAVDRPGIIACQ